jgi:hypothetical protein
MYCPKCNTPLSVKPECARCKWKSHEDPLDRPPVVCNTHNKPSVLNLVVFQTLSGVEQKGPFWKVGIFDRRKAKAKLYMRPGFIFVRWEARCERCQ